MLEQSRLRYLLCVSLVNRDVIIVAYCSISVSGTGARESVCRRENKANMAAEGSESRVVVIAMDGSECSDYAFDCK